MNTDAAAKEAVGSPLEELFDVVEDLISRVADTENPHIRKIRVKARTALAEARVFVQEAANQPDRAQSPAVPATGNVDDPPFRDRPGPALGVALLVGLGLGFVVSLRP